MNTLPRTRFLTRLAGGAALLALFGLGVAACDTSPYAATVDHQTISSATLNADLQSFSANTKLVSPDNKQVWGASNHSYNSTFVADQLTTLVEVRVIRRYIAAHHLRVSSGLLDATRALEQLSYGSKWTGFSSAYQDTLVQQAAEAAVIEPLAIPSSTARQLHTQYRSRFFSSVCVRNLTITANGADGRVDLAASRAQAQRLVNSLNRRSSASAAGAVRGGTFGCYTPSQLDAQPFGYDVLGIPTYHASKPAREPFGYRVLVVTRRHLLPLHPDVVKVLNLGYTNRTLNRLVRAADIKVNAAYGAWDNQRRVAESTSTGGTTTVVSPGVVPPSAPSNARQRPFTARGPGSALSGGLAEP